MTAPHKISNDDWRKHKATICRLYKDEDMPMTRLIRVMSEKHCFDASKPQYMRQFRAWGVRKNQKGDFWKDLSRLLKNMKLNVADVDVFFNERLIPERKLRKQLPRYDLPTWTQTTARCRIPDGIFIRPKIQIPRSLIISLPWYQICSQLEIAMSSSATRMDRPPSPLPSAVVDVTDGFLGLDYDGYWKEGVLRLSLETDMDQLCLPYLEFAEHGTVQKAPKFNNIVNTAIAGLLDLPPWWTRRELFAHTMAQIAVYMPERRPGETENIVNQLIDPNSTTRMQVFMSFAALVLANNLLDKKQVDAFVITLDEVAGPSAFDMLTLRDDPSTGAIISEVLFAAVRTDKGGLVKSALRNGVNVNRRSTGFYSQTLIVDAVQRNKVRIVEMLVDAGADITPGRRDVRRGHESGCPLFQYSVKCTASEYYQFGDVYCCCETNWAKIECPIAAAASSCSADKLIPRLLKTSVSTLAGPVMVSAMRGGANRETVELLLRNGASANECSLQYHHYPFGIDDDRNCTALSAAACSGDMEMARLLLDYGANPNGPITCGHKRIIEDWAEQLYQSPLVVAAKRANLDMVRLLIERGADPNWSILDMLEESRREEAIQEIEWTRDSYADKNTRILVHFPLQASALLEDPAITEYLISKGAAVNPGHGTPPLSIAAYHGRDATVDLLIMWGATINPVNAKACSLSPLQGAVCSGKENMVRRMISAGADLNWCSSGRWGGTALQCAAERGLGAIFDILRCAGTRLDSSSTPNHATTILQEFVKHRDYDRSLGLLQDGVSPNGVSKDGSSPLLAAILRRDVSLISLLLEWGADADDAHPKPALYYEQVMPPYLAHNINEMLQEDPNHSLPPLHWAVVMGNLDVVTRLYNAGADVNKTDCSGDCRENTHGLTALHLAVACKHKNIVEFLLGEGADVNSIFRYTDFDILQSPVTISVGNSDYEITKILLQHGADPYLGQLGNNKIQEDARQLPRDLFALEEACLRGDVQMVRLLMSSGVDVRVGYPLVFTFLGEAIYDTSRITEQRREIMELLLAGGVEVNHRAADIFPPLQAALRCDGSTQSVRAIRLLCARRLIEMGAEINAVPSRRYGGRTALQAAVQTGEVEIVQYLLSKGAEVNAPAAPDRGVTALQAAAIKGYLRIAQILLEYGAEIDADPSPKHGRRAIDGAAEWGRIDMVKLLLDNYDGPRPISKVCESAMKYAKKENQWYVMKFLESYTPPKQ
ncbi:uncharacterized protein PV07_12324 [Cladophialophora immunda]|uniref:Clr5 domain-containing protein n=1 Tax=Cladophialophora immunda TaxID=569365 RepID=A0A0D2CFX0_9EURO|nr:uncharacterized protein PV07_12324 [Cladophialophora immunda]KIW22439.1 hypothetical protein PV07_12324 [Cladophialophora immunda]OQU98220.1 Clr5 domain-containing protein [Cladophialophora immunda]